MNVSELECRCDVVSILFGHTQYIHQSPQVGFTAALLRGGLHSDPLRGGMCRVRHSEHCDGLLPRRPGGWSWIV